MDPQTLRYYVAAFWPIGLMVAAGILITIFAAGFETGRRSLLESAAVAARSAQSGQ